jgi:class I fructose-bisphosphate aldolase
MTDRVREILSWYGAESPGVLTNLSRLLNHGTLAGTGRLVILPVDQGFEHGPTRSFGPNPPGYDPRYHFQLAIEAGCNGYAAPLGALEAGAREFAGDVPLILKASNHDLTLDERDPTQAFTASIDDALRLGCVAVGYTIYPGSTGRLEFYEKLRGRIEEAKRAGLVVILWSYPRGSGISKEGETSLDVDAYAAHLACQLGAHIVKVKLPADRIEFDAIRKVVDAIKLPTSTLVERIQHIVQSSFAGRRIVIFSGGAFDSADTLVADAKAIREGGGFGSIMGRNSFQRPKAEGLDLLRRVMAEYAR